MREFTATANVPIVNLEYTYSLVGTGVVLTYCVAMLMQ